jgi:TRAP transporter TAXI family solute receptor
MLKRSILSILLVCLLLIAITAFPAIAAIKFIGISTGSTGGTFYPVGVIFATTFSEELKDMGYKFSAHVSGGSSENLEMIRNKEIEMIIVGSVPTAQAYLGIGHYKDKAIKNVRFITALWPEAEQTVYRKGIGIKTFADFKGRKISVGPAGGGGTIYLPIVLKELAGLTFDDFSPQYLGMDDCAQALQNRLIDAAYMASRVPTPAVSQIFASRVPVDIIEITDEEFAKLRKVAPFFARVTIPKGTYPNQDRDLKLYAVKSSLAVEENLDDDVVYKMLEVMYIKRIDDLGKQHGALKILNLDGAIKGLSGAPLHPGAVKFYRDHGIEVPDSLIPPEMK